MAYKFQFGSTLTRDVTEESPPAEPPTASAPRRAHPTRIETARDVAKFTGMVALLAILADAAVGHALLWENDPYWTYWITKTFLIATIFGLGTAWVGVGAGRGAAITAVHTLVLTVYYWSFSPIGFPSHPEWLDLEHTWVTGAPVHFGVIYLGYLASLWIWRRREGLRRGGEDSPAALATTALGVGLVIVVVGGGLVSLALGEFPGVTWLLVRLLLTVPFLMAWWSGAGRDRVAAVAGGITLGLVYGAYSHFLGPLGLPDAPYRIATQPPPPATVHWLSYRQDWLTAVPILTAVSVLALLAVSRGAQRTSGSVALGAAAVGVAVVAVALGALVFPENLPRGDVATVSASGPVQVEQGAWYTGNFGSGAGDVRLVAQDRSPRVSPLPPHDQVDLVATVRHPDGTTYRVEADRPMVDDPLGRFETWWGVGLHRWHHGDSGIGTRKLPAVRSEVAVFGVGRVMADGRPVAAGVPVHLMTMQHPMPGRLELDVGDEELSLPGLPDGHLRAVWADYQGGAGQGPRRSRNLLGNGVLLGLLVLAGLAVRRDSAAAV